MTRTVPRVESIEQPHRFDEGSEDALLLCDGPRPHVIPVDFARLSAEDSPGVDDAEVSGTAPSLTGFDVKIPFLLHDGEVLQALMKLLTAVLAQVTLHPATSSDDAASLPSHAGLTAWTGGCVKFAGRFGLHFGHSSSWD